MIRKLIFITIIASSTACAEMQVMHKKPDTDTAPPLSSENTKGFEFKVIDAETREKLGLKPDDLLLAIPRESKKTIIYTNERNNVADGKEFIHDKELTNFVQIFSLRSSPECQWIWNGVGGKIWYPWPGCPKP